MISLPMNIINQELQITSTYDNTQGPFCLADVQSLKSQFFQAGFADVTTQFVNVIFEIPSGQEFISTIQELRPEIRTTLDNVSISEKKQILKAITDELYLKHTDPETGRIRLVNETIIISGKKVNM